MILRRNAQSDLDRLYGRRLGNATTGSLGETEAPDTGYVEGTEEDSGAPIASLVSVYGEDSGSSG